MAEADAEYVSSLHAGDEALFSDFECGADQEDLDAALVDLNDWAVFGALGQDGRSVTIASAYPLSDMQLADTRVQTLEYARGNGYATQLLRAACSTCYDAWVRTVLSLPAGQQSSHRLGLGRRIDVVWPL